LAKIRVKEGEALSEGNIKFVIELLAGTPPITKKEAYEILNISPNPKRLAQIIENYHAEQEERTRRKAANRGKPANDFEIQTVIEGFLDGESVSELAEKLYRPTSFIKDVIEKIGVPQRVVGGDYWKPGFVPDNCIRTEFEVGQVVWSARDNAMAIIRGEETNVKDKANKYYSIYVVDPIEEPSPYFPQYQDYGGFHSGSYAYDLANLDHLKQYGVDVYRPYRNSFKNWLKGR